MESAPAVPPWQLALPILACALACATDLGGPPSPTVASVEVSPASDSLDALGATRTFTAAARDAAGALVNSETIAWTSLDTGVARVSASGVATAVGNGATQIVATAAGVSGHATLRIAQTVSALLLSSPHTVLAPGATLQLAAEARDRLGSPVATPPITWASSDPAVLSVDGTGLVTAHTEGTATVSVRAGPIADSVQLTALHRVGTVTLVADRVGLVAIADTARVVAEVRDSAGALISSISITWWSTVPAVATVSPDGLVTAHANGATSIFAEAGGVSGSIGMTVQQQTARLDLTPDSLVLRFTPGSPTAAFTATARDANGHAVDPQPSVEWVTRLPAVATVSPSGVVSPLAYGSVTIVGAVDTAADSSVVHVVPAVRQLSGAGYHACVLSERDETLCWGRNSEGQLGLGHRDPSETAALSAGGYPVAQVSAGWFHTSALTPAGTALRWGPNPVAVGTDLTIALTAVGSGAENVVIALGSDGRARWLADTSATDSTTVVDSATIVTSLSTGFLHGCGLTPAGLPACWGYDGFGQLGSDSGFPEPLVTLTMGLYHGCGLTGAGRAYCWGANLHGQLGDGTRRHRRNALEVIGGRTFTSISAGAYHTCAIEQGGAAYCWGWDEFAQLGVDGTEDRLIAEPVATALRFTRIAAGVAHTCGESLDGRLWCWGGSAPSPHPVAFGVAGTSTAPLATVGPDHPDILEAILLAGRGRALCAAAVGASPDPDRRTVAAAWRCP